MSAIEMKGICKSFGSKTVLKDVSLTVKKGEIFGLLGPSGAGKTTMIKVLTGQLAPDKGEAVVLGDRVPKLSDSTYARIGMVLDTGGVYGRLSVKANMQLFADIFGVPRSLADSALEQVGIAEMKRQGAGSLSKGQLQRLKLARAILHSPDLLFLDEPTSGLDPVSMKHVQDLIREQREGGATVFLTTHNMVEASKLCNRLILLNDGQVVECGTPEALCEKYDTSSAVRIRLIDGKFVELKNDGASAGEIANLFAQGSVRTIHSTEPDLEQVFISLTGRELI